MVSVWHPYLHLKMNQSDMINLTDRYFFIKIVPRVNSLGHNLDYGVLQKNHSGDKPEIEPWTVRMSFFIKVATFDF